MPPAALAAENDRHTSGLEQAAGGGMPLMTSSLQGCSGTGAHLCTNLQGGEARAACQTR